MVEIHKKEITIEDKHIDYNGHVNNVNFVQWMQDIAIDHSDVNVPADFYPSHNTTWFAVSHTINYKNQAFLGDVVEAYTWISEIKNSSSTRKYRFINKENGKILAEALTNWVYIDQKTGRPKRIDEDLQQYYRAVEN